ncbi:MAG: hypothetical protein OEW09_06860 [Anaerolineae bacterium]|nr:hypothetical protein [Anaerolineae bacterium]
MEIAVADERAYWIKETLTLEQAQGRAWAKKADAFGTIAKFLQRPKDTEIELTYSEKRYEPFWHVVCHARYVYDRERKYTLNVESTEVKALTIQGERYEVQEKPKPHIALPATEHCSEECSREVFVDAISGDKQDWASYLKYDSTLIEDIDHFTLEGAIIVPPEVRASLVVREILGNLMKVVQADTVHEELVKVETVDLYYRPLYAFEYLWQPKDKRAVIEFDGLTGEIRTDGKAIRQQVGKVLTKEVLFDIGVDTVDLFVPGGGIAIKLVKALAERKK